VIRRIMNSEIVDFFSGPKLWTEPTWVLPRPDQVSVAAHAMVLRPQLTQPFLKLGLFRQEFAA
jgi:hypothetical protein